MKSFEELDKEQRQRENTLSSQLTGENEMQDLTHFEASLSQQQNKILFEITTQIEDTENALKQAEQFVQRIKKHLEKLKSLQRVLSGKKAK